MARVQGYILLIVLIFLQLFSVLGLYELTAITWSLKVSKDAQQQEALHDEALQSLGAAEKMVGGDEPVCLVSVGVSDTAAQNSNDWWAEWGCEGQLASSTYYYIVEFLASDPCAVVGKFNNNQALTANYYLITLVSLPKSASLAKIILQSTIIKADNKPKLCTEKPHLVYLGRQMWRDINT